MRTYILKRVLLMFPTLLGVTFLVFLITRLAPGDPAAMKVGVGAGTGQMGSEQDAAEIIEKFREDWHLDEPIPVQYILWLGKVASGDFGESYKDGRPVLTKIWERLGVTVTLNVISLTLIYLIAIPLGIFSAVKKGALSDKLVSLGLFVLYSLPNFFVATLCLMYLCSAEYWNIFPVTGLKSDDFESLSLLGQVFDRLRHLVLPVACLTYGGLAYVSRQMRAGMLEVIRQDYIRTARAKGLPERVVIFKHALRNSLIPIITLIATLLPAMIAGSVIIEKIFTLQGLGLLSFEAIEGRDYNVILTIILFTSFLTMLGMLLADILYAVVNPTIQLR